MRPGINYSRGFDEDKFVLKDLDATTITNPALNAAVSTAIIDEYGGIIITLTGAGNAQTLQNPTDTSKIKRFIVVTNSTNGAHTIEVNGITLSAGEAQRFIWDGSAWVAVTAVDADDISFTPSGNIVATTVQAMGEELDVKKIAKSLLDAQSIIVAVINDTPINLSVPEQRMIGRITGGNVSVLTPAQVRTLLNIANGADATGSMNVAAAGAVMDADFAAADEIMVGTGAETHGQVTLAPSQMLGKKAAGGVVNLTVAEVLTLLGLGDALTYKGVIDCGANPNYPAADAGDYYKISVAGKIGGASGVVVELGDALICTTDSTVSGDQATVGSFWNVLQTNIDLANSGPINMQDALLTRPEIKDYSETKTASSSASNVLTLDIENGNVFSTLLTENVTTLNFDKPSPTGKACSFTWVMTQHSAAVTVTWPASVKWDSGTAPTITANNGIYVFTFMTYDAGTTWYGFLAGSEMA